MTISARLYGRRPYVWHVFSELGFIIAGLVDSEMMFRSPVNLALTCILLMVVFLCGKEGVKD